MANPTTKICIICQSEFRVNGNFPQKTCCKLCSNLRRKETQRAHSAAMRKLNRKNPIDKECVVCGNKFQSVHYKKTCSEKCSAKNDRDNILKRKAIFRLANPRQDFFSNTCKDCGCGFLSKSNQRKRCEPCNKKHSLLRARKKAAEQWLRLKSDPQRMAAKIKSNRISRIKHRNLIRSDPIRFEKYKEQNRQYKAQHKIRRRAQRRIIKFLAAAKGLPVKQTTPNKHERNKNHTKKQNQLGVRKYTFRHRTGRHRLQSHSCVS